MLILIFFLGLTFARKNPLPGQQIPGGAGKGGIFGSATVDPGPPCCQICTKKFYHALALLDLSEKEEHISLTRFHHYRNLHNARHSASSVTSTLLQTNSHHQRHYLKTTTTKQQRMSKAGLMSNLMSSVSSKTGAIGNLGGVIGATAANSHAGSTANKYSDADALERISYLVDDAKQGGPHEMQSTPPLFKTPDRMEGARGGGPCCNVCPLWFVPTNQNANGRIVPDTFLVEESSHHKKGFLGGSSGSNGVGATSRGSVGAGPSQCCNVCTDEAFPMRDINSVNDITFVQIKSTVQQWKEKQNIQSASKMPAAAPPAPPPPPNPEQCCYLCSEQANGGWEGTAPFSEPTSWGQHLENQSKDPEFMKDLANQRTFSHSSSVSANYKKQAAVMDTLGTSRL